MFPYCASKNKLSIALIFATNIGTRFYKLFCNETIFHDIMEINSRLHKLFRNVKINFKNFITILTNCKVKVIARIVRVKSLVFAQP